MTYWVNKAICSGTF